MQTPPGRRQGQGPQFYGLVTLHKWFQKQMETVEEHPHWGTWCPRLPHTKAMSGSPQHTVGTPHSPQEPPAYSILYQGADEACPGWHRGQPCSSQSWVHGPALGLPATPGTAQYWARVTPSLSPRLISSVPPSHGSLTWLPLTWP